MPRHPRSLFARAAAAVAAAALTLAACGGDDSSDADSAPTLPLESQSSTSVAEGATSSAPSATDTGTDTAPETTEAPLTSGTTPGKPTVDSLPAGPLTSLGITDLVEGTGPAAADGDTVLVDYVGVRAADGTEFDNSYDRGQPYPVSPLGMASVIEGWNDGLVGVKAGGRRQLDVPSAMAYGDDPPGDPIQAGDDLTFLVDVRAVVPAADPAAQPALTTATPTSGTTATTSTDVVTGDGAEAARGSIAVVHYVAYSGVDGSVLDSSWTDGGAPFVLQVGAGQYLPGFDTGVEGMRVGGRREVVIPPADAFGDAGSEDLGLPAGADLIMVFDLAAVV